MSRLLFCLITDRTIHHRALHEVARQAEEAKLDYFQLREKDMTPSDLLQHARHIRPMLVHTRFIVNGSLDVALASGADGVHLQKENLPVWAVRQKYPQLEIGYSAHSREEMEQAQGDGADYVFISPVFEPRSKNSQSTPIGLETLQRWTQGLHIRIFALGGITPESFSAVKEAGCAGIASISLFVENDLFLVPKEAVN